MRFTARRRKRARTGGFRVACTPEGFVIDAVEFVGSESLPLTLHTSRMVEAHLPILESDSTTTWCVKNKHLCVIVQRGICKIATQE